MKKKDEEEKSIENINEKNNVNNDNINDKDANTKKVKNKEKSQQVERPVLRIRQSTPNILK